MAQDTLGRLFFNRVQRYGTRKAYSLKKDDGWYDVSWRDYGRRVEAFAYGLLAIGMERGDRVSILATTREEWDITDRAVIVLGGISVGIYHSNTTEQVEHILVHSETKIAVVEDREQWEKIASMPDTAGTLSKVIVMDPFPDMEDEPLVIGFEDVVALGTEQRDDYDAELGSRIEAAKPEEPVAYFYTSGTTGPPKGAVHTHASILAACKGIHESGNYGEDEVHLVWLPLPHIYQRIALHAAVFMGNSWAWAEGMEKLVENIAEVRPTIFYSVPRVYEKIHTKILGRAEEGSAFAKKIFHWSLAVGSRVALAIREGRKPAFKDRILYRLAKALVFGKIQETMGGRVKFVVSGGAPISMEILTFFHAAGILTLELYGITETFLCTMNLDSAYRFGTVGKAAPGTELRIAEDGEIMVRGPQLFEGYLKEPEKTAEVLEPDGWYHTGDIGTMDADGYVTITDRKKDLIITSGGKNVAPQNIENLMKVSPYVSQMMVYGDKRNYLTALVTLDEEEVSTWARAQGIAFSGFEELAANEGVRALVDGIIKEKNNELARYETIKKFTILPKDFTQEAGELTPTMKVKRKAVTEKYFDLLDKMYR